MCEKRKIVKKILYYASVQVISPISISSGEDGLTYRDVLRDYDKNPYISGASLAGAMRGYLGYQKTDECVFGYLQGNDSGKMSSVFVSDLTFKNRKDTVTAIRDSVALSENKTAIETAKFDMEVIDSGAEGYFVLEFVLRESDENSDKVKENIKENEWLHELCQAIYGFQRGEIRLGAKKTRGYGEIKFTSLRKKEYTAQNIEKYAADYVLKEMPEKTQNWEDVLSEYLNKFNFSGEFLRMEVPLRLTGGISIRQYAARKDEPDFVHISANNKPVVPGTSFAGAIRHRVSEILTLAGESKETPLRIMFGFVEGNIAHKSNIVISEKEIEGGEWLTMTRTGISRFESAAKKGALYKERAYVEGRINLTIDIRKDGNAEWIIGLLLLAVKDIANGYLPVGGQTAIGRGIFKLDGTIKLDGEFVDEEKYLKDCLKNMRRAVACSN